MVKLLDNVCREIARNSPRDYVVYVVQPFLTAFTGEVDVP